MSGAVGGRFYHSAMAYRGTPCRGALRLRATILRHSTVILRLAVLAGAVLGFALSELTR